MWIVQQIQMNYFHQICQLSGWIDVIVSPKAHADIEWHPSLSLSLRRVDAPECTRKFLRAYRSEASCTNCDLDIYYSLHNL